VKGYNLFRHLGAPAVQELEFETDVLYFVRPRKLGNFTAGELRKVAAVLGRDAQCRRRQADALEADAKQLRTLADAMEPDTEGRSA
jgi:hypothetical protein